MYRKPICSLAAVIALCLLSGNAWGQEARANIEGRVTDPQGAAVPGAQVSVFSEDTNVRQETVTNEQGSWTVRFLNPGSYRILVSAAGFKASERKGIVLQTADMKQVDLVLEVGAHTEKVTVTAEVSLIDTTAATSGTVIETGVVTEMPVMSRIPFQLATMSPGVLATDQNNNVAMMWSKNAASGIRVNGGRDDRSNEFLLDGMPNQNRDKVAFIPPADAVAEFRIMSNAYDAQYGRQAGGTLNVSVKAGTNQYHGNVYEFNRNDAYSANTFQANRSGLPKSMTRYNLWGGTFGGPVWLPKLYQGRDKTFFFVSYEGIRNQDPRAGTRSVPTAEERGGDFTNSWTTQTIGGVRTVVPITIYDPATVDSRRTIVQNGKEAQNPLYGYRQPFAGNRIPASRLSPIATNVLKFVPLPNTANQPNNSTANNFTPNSTRQNKMATFMTRADHNWNNSHKTFASVRWSHMDEFTGDDFHNVTTGNRRTRINRGVGIDHVYTLGPAKILNLRFNITRYVEPNYDNGADFNPVDLGFSQSYVSQMQKLSFPRITGLFGDIGGSYSDYTNTTYYNWNANLTHVVGNMTLHYGGEYRVLQDATGDWGNQSGQFDFNSNWTRERYDTSSTGKGSTTASFLLGLPNGGSFPRNANRIDSQRYAGLYFQNDWRVTSRLTVNVGLRWDYQRPAIERFGRTVSDFDPTVVNPISDSAQASYSAIMTRVLADPVRYPFGAQLAQLVPVSSFKVMGVQKYAGVDGEPVTAANSVWSQWQPRVGAAFRLDNKTVIRAGFGKFYMSTGSTQGQNGFSRSTSFVSSIDSGITPYDTLATPFRNGIMEPTGNTLGGMTNLGNGVNWLSRDGHLPYSWEYSLHLQREFKSWLFEAGYTHNKTYDIFQDRQQNDIGLDNWLSLRTPRFDANGKPLARPYLTDEQIPNPFYKLPGVTGSRGNSTLISVYDLMRPIKIIGGQNRNGNPAGKNQYDSLQAKVERRFRGGFSMLFAYTFSKLFEDTSFWGNEIAGVIEHKLGGEDRPHKVSIAPVLLLPVGRGKKVGGGMPKILDAFVGGWQVSGQYLIQSGTPVVFGTNSFFDGQDFGIARTERTLGKWFDTSHFVKFPNSGDDISKWPAWTGIHNMPGANFVPKSSSDPKNAVYANFGNYLRRYPTRWANVRESRVNELNFGLFKNFKFGERVKAQLRAEFFNVFNHARFDGPNTDPGSSSFGIVSPSQVNQPRVGQMALKLSF
ncbi:MAG: carboxypeptidase regulatory-like domain-containing protein [Acidobacteriales bacterium]|nr:carboxypeptidase regulatory-like domain-containing protein [Terriglobales bacterium]